MTPQTETVERNWGAEPWRQPKHEETDTVLHSECGRVLGLAGVPGVRAGHRVDYRSHWFKLVLQQHGGYALLVSHGGGEERVPLGYRRFLEGVFNALDSDARFLLMWQMLDIHHNAERAAQDATAKMYRTAFVEGRLTKRKVRGSNQYKVTLA